ncbi:MAG TPA: hypothetical protein VF519_16015 [Mycobacteriales bacterium]|jgi:hypothetical protein
MRRTLASLLVAVSAAGLLVGLAGTASASALPVSGDCVAYGDVPHLNVGGTSRIVTTGTFSCAAAHPGMAITVCIEEMYGVAGPWYSRGCTSDSDLNELRTSLTATHSMSVPVYATYLRTVVRGTNADGSSVNYTSPPVFWFNCACYIG